MKTNKRGHGRKSVLNLLKRRVILFIMLLFIGYSYMMNSTKIDSAGKQAQSQMNEVVPEVAVETVKNFDLTVNTDLTIPSNVEPEDIDKMLEGTALMGMGKTFVQAEKEAGVNALYMMGLACLESGYGESEFAKERNNLYGWNAIDSDPSLAKKFESKEEATLFVAKKLAENYLQEGGPYYEGKTPRAVDVHYCTDKQHADKICSIVQTLREKIK